MTHEFVHLPGAHSRELLRNPPPRYIGFLRVIAALRGTCQNIPRNICYVTAQKKFPRNLKTMKNYEKLTRMRHHAPNPSSHVT
jgi:hypothetical protein